MISDRWGYFENGYHYWPAIVRSGDYYGLDRNDPIYRKRQPLERGVETCPSCHLHAATDRNYPCDVFLARAADIEAAGYPATFCRSCSRAMPVRSGQPESLPKCWYCERAKAPRRRVHEDGGVRISDGLGCSEKVPAWILDPNEGRVA